jgi:hypothetical protein
MHVKFFRFAFAFISFRVCGRLPFFWYINFTNCLILKVEREDKYDPMNFSDEEAPAKTEKAEEIPPLSENESDDDGPPPLEFAGPPELEEIPPHHEDNMFQNQPLDDVINSYTVTFEILLFEIT